MSVTILTGDCRDVLPTLPERSVQCCVTSPPYFGLRDYNVDGQIGLERTVEEYVAQMVAVFRAVRRVLADDGVLWLNLGDSYAAQRGGTHQPAETLAGGRGGKTESGDRVNRGRFDGYNPTRNASAIGFKHKDLIGIPWRVAFALQADGWWLRSDCIWSKPNPMPESVTDRPTRSHEYVFLLTKSARYFYDADAVREAAIGADRVRADRVGGNKYVEGVKHSDGAVFVSATERRLRSVWTITPRPFRGAHFATFPPELAERCVKAGSRPGDAVLDPFGGSGTTGMVADRLGRDAVLVELNPEYAE
ncbi:MAG TPA: site-specific DNA-methyltransferase, partial [Gemmata sp.]